MKPKCLKPKCQKLWIRDNRCSDILTHLVISGPSCLVVANAIAAVPEWCAGAGFSKHIPSVVDGAVSNLETGAVVASGGILQPESVRARSGPDVSGVVVKGGDERIRSYAVLMLLRCMPKTLIRLLRH